MKKMRMEEIKRVYSNVNYLIESAMEEKDATRYWLEKLPISGDYDMTVHEYINDIEYSINNYQFGYVGILKNELIEHYLVNFKNYDEDDF